MASLALGVAGAFVGSAFGPLGASIGWTIGAAIGNALDPQKVQGPRLSDLRVHTSSYGQMTPRLWGVMRLAGNIIDGKDKFDEHEETSGGKGGGPEVTNFTYSYTFAVRLCERVGNRNSAILGIKRVWGNGRTLDMSTLPMTIYLGTEEQLPDPTLETIHGVGNVPAYRSIAYIVFTDLSLTDYGNAIPNLEFECYTHAGVIPERISSFTTNPNASSGNILHGVTYNDGVITVATYRQDNFHYYRQSFLLDGTPTGEDEDFGTGAYQFQCAIRNLDVASMLTDSSHNFWWVNGVATTEILSGSPYGTGVWQDGFIYCVGGPSPVRLLRYPALEGVPLGGADINIAAPSGPASNLQLGTSDEGHIYVFDHGSGYMYEYNAELALTHVWNNADWPAGFNYSSVGGFSFVRYHDFFALSYSGLSSNLMNLVSIAPNYALSLYPQERDGSDRPTYQFLSGPIITLSGGLVLGIDGVTLLDPPLAGVLLSEIVADISQDCGLDRDDDIDVSDLTDVVDGYLVAQQGTGREWIQPLRDVWTFDAFEADQATFVHRGKQAIVTIPDDELAAHVHGEEPPPIMGTVRMDELSLPATVNLSFVDASADYQTNTQYGRRQATFAVSEVSMSVPINLSMVKAKSVAEIQLDEAWNERNRFTFRTSNKYLKYTPTDVINAHGLDIRIVDKKETHPGVIQWDGVFSRAQAFVQSGISVPRLDFTSSPPEVVTIGGTVTTYLLDIPLVSDDDTQAGFYAAMGSRGTLFKSSDGGATYSSVAATAVPDVIGTTSDVLGPFYGGNVFDESNIVTVVTTGGELENATETTVLNGANEAVVGDEVIQFKNAELVDTDTYELSGLLRGRLGTEWAIEGHSSGERFAMLPALRVASTELNVARSYKPVPTGGTVSGTTAQGFTNTGQSLKPYSPVLLGGGADGSGDVELHWTRRTRIGGAWIPFYDVPLSESSEAYKVQIWNSDYTQVARIMDVTSPSVTYTSAMQITDFGADQQNIYFTVAQVGVVLGQQARGVAVGDGSSDDDPISPIPPYQSPTSGSPDPPPDLDALELSLTWANPGNQRTYSNIDGAFACDKIVVVQFTTPAGTAPDVIGSITAGEWSSGTGPITRVACLSTIPGDFSGTDLGPNSRVVSSGPTVQFSVGTNSRVYPTPELASSTTYYFNIKNDNGFGACTCFTSDCDIFVELRKPTGL